MILPYDAIQAGWNFRKGHLFTQTSAKFGVSLQPNLTGSRGMEIPNHWHRLLRVRSQRPGGNTANKCDEFPSRHGAFG
jgi:hypothetical protein